jgi:hypothetical protein
MNNKPSWYTEESDGAWDRVKAAMGNDWEQTKNDFGSKTARDLKQDVDNTVKQAAGSPEGIENREQAFRFGYAAQRNYKTQYPTWNNDLETRLRQDYGSDFDRDRDYIRHAYEYRGTGSTETTREETRDRM